MLVLLASGLTGCQTIGVIAGTVAGVATGSATQSGAIGMAVGIAVQAATDQGMKVVDRRKHRAEQDAIAAVAGEMNPGETRAWEMKHALARHRSYGQVRVTRVIKTPLAVCKEVLFSVMDGDDEKPAAWFATSACQRGEKWKWAAAEPAVERWGNLQ